jgi:hypothetical protein
MQDVRTEDITILNSVKDLLIPLVKTFLQQWLCIDIEISSDV